MAGRIVTYYLQWKEKLPKIFFSLQASQVFCVCPPFETWQFIVLVGWFSDTHSCQTCATDMSPSCRLKCYATADLLWLASAQEGTPNLQNTKICCGLFGSELRSAERRGYSERFGRSSDSKFRGDPDPIGGLRIHHCASWCDRSDCKQDRTGQYVCFSVWFSGTYGTFIYSFYCHIYKLWSILIRILSTVEIVSYDS